MGKSFARIFSPLFSSLAVATRPQDFETVPVTSSDATGLTGRTLENSPIIERPLTESETNFLRNTLKKGALPGLRLLGVLTGIMPLFLVGAAVMGLPMVPENYTVIIIVTGFLGVAFGGASKALRTPIARVLGTGTAREVYGVPETRTPNARAVEVGLASLSFQLKPVQAQRLSPNRMNKVVYADGGITGGSKSRKGWSVGVALEWNGTAVSKRETFLVKTGNAGVMK